MLWRGMSQIVWHLSFLITYKETVRAVVVQITFGHNAFDRAWLVIEITKIHGSMGYGERVLPIPEL